MKVFRWRNCYADIVASKHGFTVQSFLDDVITPAIRALEERIVALGCSDNPGDVFAQADADVVLQETKMAFCLSIQSIWERQLRGYLHGCAKELQPANRNLVKRAVKGNWRGLCELFLELRGIRLDAFPSFSELDLLQLLGNACRHGDGFSATELAQRCPELWPAYLSVSFGGRLLDPERRSVEKMDVPVDRLRAFVAAIVAFWGDAEYIYNESIEGTSQGLEARLAQQRKDRSWWPQATSDDGALS